MTIMHHYFHTISSIHTITHFTKILSKFDSKLFIPWMFCTQCFNTDQFPRSGHQKCLSKQDKWAILLCRQKHVASFEMLRSFEHVKIWNTGKCYDHFFYMGIIWALAHKYLLKLKSYLSAGLELLIIKNPNAWCQEGPCGLLGFVVDQ